MSRVNVASRGVFLSVALPLPQAKPAKPIPVRRSRRTVQPDRDYIAQLEEQDGQKMKRRAAGARGKRVKAPEPRPG